MEQKTWWQRNRKDVFLLLAVLTTLLTAVMGWHWTDTAEKPFWQNFWVVAAIAADLIWVGAWAYFWNKDKSRYKKP
jgi:undecaprenyl pyrophosphate phosphatase UppP